MSSSQRKRATIRLMIGIFCHGRHGTQAVLCAKCGELLAYAEQRLDRCPRRDKPACRTCRHHCYDKAHGEAIREVMRYAGRRMFFRHPVATLLHLIGR